MLRATVLAAAVALAWPAAAAQYSAHVLAILGDGRPMQFDDTRGPYDTEQACSERVKEMIATIRQAMPTRGGRGFCQEVKPEGKET